MKRTLAALLLTGAAALTGACGNVDGSTSGDSVTDNQQTLQPGTDPSEQPNN
jgi:hypothetical protein